MRRFIMAFKTPGSKIGICFEDLDEHNVGKNCSFQPEECETGNWVLWEDVREYIEQTDRIEKLIKKEFKKLQISAKHGGL